MNIEDNTYKIVRKSSEFGTEILLKQPTFFKSDD